MTQLYEIKSKTIRKPKKEPFLGFSSEGDNCS